MGEVLITKYTDKYREDVIDLILSIQQKEFNIPITKEDQPDLSNIANFYQSGDGNFWIALNNGQVVGTIALINLGNHQGALRKMFVKAAFRGSRYNVAKSLLHQLMIWSSEHDLYEIYLGTTEKFLAAHRFYGKNGFVQVNKVLLPETFPIMQVDTSFYKLKIE